MINDTNTICITDDDDIEGIIKKIKESEEPKINLVAFSHKSSVLSVINFKLFKKIAASADKSLLVSTNDDTVKMLAEKAGVEFNFLLDRGKMGFALKAKEFLLTGEKSMQGFNKNIKSVDSVGLGRRVSSGPSFQSKPLPENEFYSPKKISEFHISGGSKKILAVFLVLAAIVVVVAGYIILSTAKITIIPKTQPLSANFEFILNKNITSPDKTAKEIPTTVIVADVEKSGQFTATGKKEVSSKSTGIVTVYNECSTTPRSLKTNNQISAANGKLFYTTQAITIPGMVIEDGAVTPGSIDVPIIAVKVGAEYNIDPTTFTFMALKSAKCQKITAKSVVATSGGATGYATVVSDSDLKKAKDFLESEAQKDLLAQLNEKKPSDLILVPESISVKSGDLTTGAKADQVAAKFQASLKTSAIAFLFNSAYVKDIAKDIFTGVGQEKNNYVILDSYEFTYSNPEILNPDKIKMSVEARSTAYQAIDTNKTKSNLLGKNQGEVDNYIKSNAPEISKIQISLWPFWVKNVPILERNVAITVLLDPVK